MDPVCKLALRIAANKRLQKYGAFCRRESAISRGSDGTHLYALDRTIVFLTLWERVLTALGVWDAWDIEWRRFPLGSKGPRA